MVTDADDNKENTDVVKLMTIHAAKGLEFPVVFVGGLEETLFPNAMSINTREELEEERRLFYVAITRARLHLYLSYSNARYRFGPLQQNEPSRFIEEIPEIYVDKSYAGVASRNNQNTGWGSSNGNAFNRMQRGFQSPERQPAKTAYSSSPARPALKEHVPTENFMPSDLAELKTGNKVEHQKFGFGEVTRLEGSSHNPIATIVFQINGEKKIMLNYAKLRIVE